MIIDGRTNFSKMYSIRLSMTHSLEHKSSVSRSWCGESSLSRSTMYEDGDSTCRSVTCAATPTRYGQRLGTPIFLSM